MRAKLRHFSWKRNFVLALFEEGAFFLRLRSGEKRKEGKSEGVGDRDFGKGGGEPKIHVQNAKLACARHARVQCFHVFVFTSSPFGYISLKNSMLGVKASPLFSFTLCHEPTHGLSFGADGVKAF